MTGSPEGVQPHKAWSLQIFTDLVCGPASRSELLNGFDQIPLTSSKANV